MNTRRLRRLSIAVPLAVLLVGSGFALGRQGARGFRLFQSVFDVVAAEAADSLEADSIDPPAARGLVRALDDPYAQLFNRREFADFNRNALGNRYGGIGLRIARIRGGIQVWRVIPAAPPRRRASSAATASCRWAIR